MKLILPCLTLAASMFGADPTWTKEPDGFKGIPFGTNQTTAKNKLHSDAVNASQGQSDWEIKPHQMGETFSEWLRINQINLDEICGSHSRSDRTMDYKAVCKKLSAMRDTGQGEFYTTDGKTGSIGWRFADGKVSDYLFGGQWHTVAPPLNDVSCFTENSCSYSFAIVSGSAYANFTFEFKDNRFVGVTGSFKNNGWQDLKDVFIERYGEPQTTEHSQVQSGAGAVYENEVLYWTGPNVSLLLSKYGNQVDTGVIALHLNSYLAEENQRKAAEKKKSASGL